MQQYASNCYKLLCLHKHIFGRFVPIPPFVSLFLLISFFLPRGSWVIEKGEGRGVSNIPSVSEIPWLHQLSMQSRFVLWKTPLIVDYCTGPLPDGPSWRTPAYSSCAKPLENSPLKYRGKNQMKINFIRLYNVEGNLLNDIKRFSIECRTTKTTAITQANHKGYRQCSEPIRTRSNHM